MINIPWKEKGWEAYCGKCFANYNEAAEHEKTCQVRENKETKRHVISKE